jgi:hypothetical protein
MLSKTNAKFFVLYRNEKKTKNKKNGNTAPYRILRGNNVNPILQSVSTVFTKATKELHNVIFKYSVLILYIICDLFPRLITIISFNIANKMLDIKI